VNFFGLPGGVPASQPRKRGVGSFYWWRHDRAGSGAGFPAEQSGNLLGFCAMRRNAGECSLLLGGHTAMWSIWRGIVKFDYVSDIAAVGVAELGPLTGNGSGVRTMGYWGGTSGDPGRMRQWDSYAFFLPCLLPLLLSRKIGSKPNAPD